jgi:flagellar assembly factor FliW
MPQLTDDTTSYRFPEGIPAFEQHTSFRLTRDPRLDPLLFLTSDREPSLRFICIQVRFLVAGYSYELGEAEAALLGAAPGRYGASEEQFACLAVISVPASGPPTANLMAPVVINFDTGLGIQAVQTGEQWSCIHPMEFQEAPECS